MSNVGERPRELSANGVRARQSGLLRRLFTRRPFGSNQQLALIYWPIGRLVKVSLGAAFASRA